MLHASSPFLRSPVPATLGEEASRFLFLEREDETIFCEIESARGVVFDDVAFGDAAPRGGCVPHAAFVVTCDG